MENDKNIRIEVYTENEKKRYNVENPPVNYVYRALFGVFPKKTSKVVSEKKSKRRIKRTSKAAKEYSKEDIAFIKANYDKMSVKSIARKLGRTPHAIVNKAYELRK